MPYFKNLEGQRFGKLTVVSLLPERLVRGPRRIYVQWSCLCDCGKTKIVISNNIRKTKSCGCRGRGGPARKRPFEWLYNNFIRIAKRRGLAVNFTYDEFVVYTNQKCCHYCRKEIHWVPFRTPNVNLFNSASNLDRKNNDFDYSKDNVVVCCKTCNTAKSSTYSYEDWYGMTKYLRDKKHGSIIRTESNSREDFFAERASNGVAQSWSDTGVAIVENWREGNLQ